MPTYLPRDLGPPDHFILTENHQHLLAELTDKWMPASQVASRARESSGILDLFAFGNPGCMLSALARRGLCQSDRFESSRNVYRKNP